MQARVAVVPPPRGQRPALALDHIPKEAYDDPAQPAYGAFLP